MNLLNKLFGKPYGHQNHHGVTYYLYSKNVTLRGGKLVRIYFFNKDPKYVSQHGGSARPEPRVPDGYTLQENPRNGFLTVHRNYNPDPGEQDD